MTHLGLTFVILSACFHVVAHVVLKRSLDRLASVWWVLVWGGLLLFPVVFFDPMPWSWPLAGLVLVSGFFQFAYFYSIARAYHTGDLSVVYPLARGTAPVFLLIWATVLIGERPTPGGIVGVLVIAAGIYLIGLPRLRAWMEPLRSLRQPGPRWAVIAGLFISAYSAVDRVGVRLASPLPYLFFVNWVAIAFLTPMVLLAAGVRALRAEIGYARFNSVIAGMTTQLAYLTVLFVIHAGAPASYVGAIREISVVFGVTLGVALFKEPGSFIRVAGGACVAAGVAIIGLFG